MSVGLGLLRVLLWAAGLGVAGFLLGFLAPLILAPEANQGPLLGYFFTAPVGVVLGALAGARGARRRRAERRSRRLLRGDGVPHHRPHGRVYHTQIICPMGRSIPEREKVYDASGLALCAECERLAAARGVTVISGRRA